MQTEPHVVIVGGGFSGAAVAIHLLRLASVGVRVTLLEPREVPGAGVAYSTTEPSHRINVPAARMQLAGEEEGAFDRWYRSQPAFADDPHALLADGAVYPQRGQFGRYVAQRFAEEARASGGRLTHLREQALSVNHGEVVTDGGRRLQADLLVLAISHPPPSLPSLATPFATHPALIANPWRAGVLATIAPEASVAVMGTGLTMADTVATLTRLGHRGPIAAFSRRGLLSRSNLSGSSEPWPGEYDRGTLRQRLRQIRLDIERAAEQGQAWQVVLDAVRNQGQSIWQGLTVADRQRFLRHLRSYWDVHRYRIAPQVAGVLEQRQRDGSLRVLAARLTALEGDAQKLALTLTPRRGETLRVSADHFILTTGPAHGGLTDSQPLLRQLSQRGLIRADAFGLGLDVDRRSRAIGREGRITPNLLVSGPAARAYFGELMGLPQVADHAAAVADEALRTLGVKQSARCPAF
ncbi:FAD/NAD(P)-binding protein [Klebsiella sp. K794]|uniref:FAD/NAD(P)-binding protein n=1 Tax=Klebsiella michiganensis TaxID=1134687 RepID=A0AAJ1KM03_9ENTR|nr:FAD-dependent oxidoreductase [Klebsiella michiganensis]AKL34712.1 FAD-dependent oxidoreductase [Klebsiella oxytoca]ARB21954.1 FAD-dependent oxidoreductase [Klebsiella oxytoca]MBK6269829.1 FAD/NAD(P)-binding protein [Klebsiella michiganensis]MBZ7631193.1 FAD-dependent oxidoreductase [Klebsiella michiganensis]MDH0961449.1 FAD/NAD(P)-binding protein [Klebsiella michiganensis]